VASKLSGWHPCFFSVGFVSYFRPSGYPYSDRIFCLLPVIVGRAFENCMPLVPSPTSPPFFGSLLNCDVKNTCNYELSLNKKLMGDTNPKTYSIYFAIKNFHAARRYFAIKYATLLSDLRAERISQTVTCRYA
jgi:hypothetical protein